MANPYPPRPGPSGWRPPLTPVQRPRQPMTVGRMALTMLGGLFGGLLGIIVPFLPSFGYAMVTGGDLGIPGLLILLLLLITLPCGVVLGAVGASEDATVSAAAFPVSTRSTPPGPAPRGSDKRAPTCLSGVLDDQVVSGGSSWPARAWSSAASSRGPRRPAAACQPRT
jgi:hypothetical protein